jgi:hypothetical protein
MPNLTSPATPVSGTSVIPTTVTISSGNSLSTGISLAAGKPAGVQVLSTSIDGATKLTYQVSYDGGVTYSDFQTGSGSEYITTIAASQAASIPYQDFVGATFMKVRLGQSSTAILASTGRNIAFALVP